MKIRFVILFLIILLSFSIGIYLYPEMQLKMASHWNIHGEVDGYMSKFWGLFLMPFVLSGLFLLLLLIPRIDPLKENIKKFKSYYENFVLIIIIFLFYIYLLTVFWNLGYKFELNKLIIPAIGLLIYYIGVLIGQAKRNWFVGIRTPWTLSSEKVWDKTHEVGGKLFKLVGVITFVGILFRDYTIYFIIIPSILVVIYTFVYSYLEYQKEIEK